ncbi:copper oxidase [Ensifer sp. IC3342]|nr:copper oxidase [Ensifer sp. BRP08]MCA1451254.1 copper oxidase [Ensifer sp. IC3342]
MPIFNQPKDHTMKPAILGLLVAALATPALASGNHAGGHGEAMAVGEPGKKANASQTIRVTMKETSDGKMLFTPSSFKVRKGQTIVFAIRNAGELDHEFVLDQEDKIMEHKAVMEKFPEMEHDDPNAIRLAAGESGEIIWKFTNDGTFKIACLVPGHYDAGMHGDISVAKK